MRIARQSRSEYTKKSDLTSNRDSNGSTYPSQPTCHKVGTWPSVMQQDADDDLSCMVEALPADGRQCQAAGAYCRLVVTVCVCLRRLFLRTQTVLFVIN